MTRMKKHSQYRLILPCIVILILLAILDIIHTPPTTIDMTLAAETYLRNTEKPTPIEMFHQDGCTLFPDQLLWHDLRSACLTHDITYWAGGTDHERKAADIAFREEIAHTGPLGPTIGWLAYGSVRVFGDSFITNAIDAEWGYGWDE